MALLKIDNLTIKHYFEYSFINVVISLVPEREGEKIAEDHYYRQYMAYSHEYAPVRVMDSVEAYEEFYSSLNMEISKEADEYGLHAVNITHTSEKSPQIKYERRETLLNYLHNFDKFVYREYVEVNEITLGAMRLLCNVEKLEKDSIGSDLLLRILKTLDLFWH